MVEIQPEEGGGLQLSRAVKNEAHKQGSAKTNNNITLISTSIEIK